MSLKKVKTYEYGDGTYILEYDDTNGEHILKRKNETGQGGTGGFTIIFDGTTAGGGGFTEDGTNDTNINSIGITNVQNDIKTGIGEAWKKAGGNSKNKVLPAWIQNKDPDYVAELSGDTDYFNDKIIKDIGNIFSNWNAKDFSVELSDYTEQVIRGLVENGPLNYPQDAMYTDRISGFNQDHVRITQFTYRPPRANLFFPEEGKADLGAMLDVMSKGIERGSPLKKYLGMCKLPMPTNINDSNNVNWGSDSMNNLSAAMTMGVMNNLPGAAAGSAAAMATGMNPALAVIAGTLLQGNWGDITSGGTSGLEKIKNLSDEIIGAGGNAGALLTTTATSRLLAQAGVNVSPEAILARSQGVIPNANMELLFQSPALRSFSYDWKMTPRDEREARIIKNIIRFFKQGMAARKMNRGAGGVSLFLGTPNVFHVQYKTNQDQDMQAVNRIKTCACTGCSVNYTPDGIWSAYEEGVPVSTIMSLRFQELEPIYDTDYDCEIIEGRSWEEPRNPGDKAAGDLYPIGDNEVGY